jgi:hypothetical protein
MLHMSELYLQRVQSLASQRRATRTLAVKGSQTSDEYADADAVGPACEAEFDTTV